MRYLDIDVRAHLPQGKDGRRATARSKGKVERPFRTVKEMHETLYHFHEPKDEDEAIAWLMNFLLRYNDMQHRCELHSLSKTGLRICLPREYEPHVVRSASARLRANPKGARSAVTPGFQWPGSITKSTQT
jgi:hypothetical protein